MKYDIAVIGGGPAGYTAALKGSQQGANVVLFEGGRLGGTCLNVGCIPTKCYVSQAEMLERIRRNTQNGIFRDAGLFSFKKIYEEKERVVARLTTGVDALLKAAKVTVISENARFEDAKTLVAKGQKYEASSVIIATGSKNTTLPIPGANGKNVLDSTGLLALDRLPRSLVVIGAGVIGLEIACVMNSFGCDVTAVDILPEILPSEDREAARTLYAQLKRSGIRFELGFRVIAIEDAGSIKRTVIEKGGQRSAIDSEYVMIGVGRTPCSDTAKAIGVKCDSKGFIVVDEHMQTSVEGVYAAGDVAGGFLLAHSAYEEAETAAANCIHSGSEKVRLDVMPRCIYTMPSLAAVGPGEEESCQRGEIITGKFPFAANGKALASQLETGFVKWIAEKSSGRILGCTIVGGEGVELIGSAVMAIRREMTVKDFETLIFPHPTVSECLKEAALVSLGRTIHISNGARVIG
jgi:dihydrolipoamide dehydrogenase